MNWSQQFGTWVRSKADTIAFWSLLLIHTLLLGWIAAINAPTFDEIAHVPSGLSHWHLGNFDLYRVNPPLMRMIATIPLLIVGPKTDWTSMYDGPFARPEFAAGRKFLEINGYDSFWYFTICRWAQIPVSLLGAWICYRWARELFGKQSGLIALVLWCFCPNILAWGATLTPDLGAAVFGVTAAYTFWQWLKSPTWLTTVIAGCGLGLAELTKSTWIVLFVVWPLVWLGWRLSLRHSNSKQPPALQLATIMVVGLYLLNMGYGMEASFRPLGQFKFICHALGGDKAHEVPGNKFSDSWLGAVPVPVPANYLKGIDVQKYDFEVGKWSYLRGETKFGGWYHYYLYALVVKTPLGTLLLFACATVLVLSRRQFAASFRDEAVLLLPAIIVLVLVSSQTGFNRYLRYVLPAVPFLYIFASRVGKIFESTPSLSKILCGLTLTGTVVGSLSVYPYSMSFFNLAAGGPLGGPSHLLDANIDWGQDLLELKRFIDHHPEVSPIRLAYFGFANPKVAGFPYEPVFETTTEQQDQYKLTPGWYAISVNHVYGYRHYNGDQPIYTCFKKLTPKYMAGYSIYIYHVTPESLAKM